MKRIILLILIIQVSIANYSQIIADHTIVEDYDIIPQQYIDSVKKMWVTLAGESHSRGYRIGMQFLEDLDPRFQVSVLERGTPEGPTDQNLRFSRATWGSRDVSSGWVYNYGEEDWFTNDLAVSRTKDGLVYTNTNGFILDAMGFGWCWDMSHINSLSGGVDPVYQTRWCGTTEGGIDGNKIWGLDGDDSLLTSNRVCMDTYLQATEEYIQLCESNGYRTKIYFTTGPVDEVNYNTREKGYQRHLKNEHIRNYISHRGSGYMFDYADILVWNNAGEKNIVSWKDYSGTTQSFGFIHPDNMIDLDGSYVEDGDHIGEVGALRISKAMWWMLARMAGWDGSSGGEDNIPPTVPSDVSLVYISDSLVEIEWTGSTDNVAVTDYNVYRDDVFLGNIASTNYSDTTVSPCTEYVYTITAIDAAGNESSPSASLSVSTCIPDLAPTLIVAPNISHGVTNFDVIVRVSELNIAQTSGEIVLQIPRDDRWYLSEAFDKSLTVLDGMPLNNSDWDHSSDETYHIFTSSTPIASGGLSTFGFTITFDPGISKGVYSITTQLASGAGGEIRVSNNTDSERLDYFQ